MSRISRPASPAVTGLITFAAVLALCLGLTVFLGVTAPAQKGAADYLAQGVFCALFAVPTGAAWRSFRRAMRGRR